MPELLDFELYKQKILIQTQSERNRHLIIFLIKIPRNFEEHLWEMSELCKSIEDILNYSLFPSINVNKTLKTNCSKHQSLEISSGKQAK